MAPAPAPVINATGVVLHTNLGRAPLSAAAAEAVARAATSYSDLELDLYEGTRGSRQAHISSILCRLTGAEDALVVNNNASAVLLALSAIAHGREVVVSRGEAVEIGGGLSHTGRIEPQRRLPAGSWHHESHIRRRLRGRDLRRHRRSSQGPLQQLRHHRLHP